MSYIQYIGARYVPKVFDHDGSSDWLSGVAYEPLTIVTYYGTSFASKKPVPASVGSPNENPDYWIVCGNYNAQFESYRKKTEELQKTVDGYEDNTKRVEEVEKKVNESADKIKVNEQNITGLKESVDLYSQALSRTDMRVSVIEGELGDGDFNLSSENPTLPIRPFTTFTDAVRFGVNAIPEHASYNNRDVIRGNQYTEVRWINGENISTDVSSRIEKHTGTRNDPYTTLDYLIEKSNNGTLDLRCFITESGYYVINRPNLIGVCLHLTCRANDVHILLSGARQQSFAVYNSHLNITASGYSGCSIEMADVSSGMNWYLEACTISCHYMDVKVEPLGLIYCYGNFSGSKIKQIELTGSTVRMNSVTMTNTDNAKSAIKCSNGSKVIMLGSNMNTNRLPEDGTNNAIIELTESEAYIFASQVGNSGYGYGIKADNSKIVGTNARIATYSSNSINGNEVSNMNLIVTKTTIL